MSNTGELILIMGVAGSGKTTLGKALAEQLNYQFLDADDFHSLEAKHMMSKGVALTDAIRDIWMQRIIAALNTLWTKQSSCVLAFSGLRAKHRALLYSCAFNTYGFMLQGKPEVLAARIKQRKDHFMPVTLLQDQLNTMESASIGEALYILDISLPQAEILRNIRSLLSQSPYSNHVY